MITIAPKEETLVNRSLNVASSLEGTGSFAPRSTVGIAIAASIAVNAGAGLAVYDTALGRAPWAAAVNSTQQTITFNEPYLDYWDVVTNQYQAEFGVTFDCPLYYAFIDVGYNYQPLDRNLRWTSTPVPNPANGLFLSFDTPQRALAFDRLFWTWIPATALHISLHRHDGSIIEQWDQTDLWDTQVPWSDTFIGLTSSEAFFSARIWYTQPSTQFNPGMVIDSISFSTVPGPGPLALFAAAMASRGRRRR